MSRTRDWARGYARQAAADFSTWQVLQKDAAIPACHQLLFLQMACEKLTKAPLCTAGTTPDSLQTSHAYTAKNLPVILRQRIALSGLNRPAAAWVLRHARHLAQEIEMLAPAVKRGGQRPDNCEYPWEEQRDGPWHPSWLHVPLDWTFVPATLLTVPAGRTFLKLVRDAIQRLLESV